MTRRRALALLVCCLIWNTPVLGATLTVNAGGNLQAAIDAAQPGDTIVLQAGATFVGPFTLRAKNGTAYITIRSSTADSQLPPAGTRITPAHAPLLAKIKPGVSGAAIRTVPGASYWRLQFLEVLPGVYSEGQTVGTLIEFGSGGSVNQSSLSQVPHHLIIDRCYVHGHPSLGHRRGLALNSADSQVRDSHFSDFKLVGFDTQAILGWNGPGPYLIENNHLEAAGENVMFGGADPKIANLIPSNITIRRNLFTKPTAWRTQNWALINLLELKNAQNLTIEGNIFQNNWLAGAVGYAIAFTPRNQEGTAPWSAVRNIVFQNNVVRHVAGVFNIMGYDDFHSSRQTENIVIRNNLAYDVNPSYTTKSTLAEGRFMLIGAGPKNVKIRHNTVDNQGSGTMVFYRGASPTGPLIYDFELTSNLLRANTYGILGADGQGVGIAVFDAFTPNGVVLRNAIGGADPKKYPVGNDYPSLAAWLADFVDRASADYRLKSTSGSKNAGLDGTDIGVNFTELNAALAGSGTAPPPSPPPPTGPTPYSGTAVTLPGKIEAEFYDRGGENIAYHDTTAGNNGGVLRTNEDVDLQNSTDLGGGYKVKSAVAGEWIKYSVDVNAAGTYTITVRVASDGAGGRFHIEVGGVDKTGPLTVPDTGGWQTWQTITKTGVSLAAGKQVLRLVMDSNGASGMTGNFNWIAAASGGASGSTPYTGTPVPLPGRIQTENFDHGGENIAYRDTTSGNNGGVYRTNESVDLQEAVDTDGGFKIKSAVAGEWLNYTVNVSAAGTYTLTARVASSGAGGTFHIEVNGVDKTGRITVPDTGSWQTWRTLSKTGISLSAGRQVIRLVLDTNGASGLTGNFNWIAVQ